MRIDKRDEIFGRDFGNFLASGNIDNTGTAPEVSENEFAPNLFMIADTAIRDQKIAEYVKALEMQADPSSNNHSTCRRLLRKLNEEAAKQHTSPELLDLIKKTGLVFDSFVKTKEQSTLIDADLPNLTSTQPTVVYGKYPDATCHITDLGERAKNTKLLKKLSKRIKKDAKHDPALDKKSFEAKEFDRKLGKDYRARAYLENRISTLNANHVRTDNLAQFILSACPRPNEITDHLYHTLLASDCSLWFTLNQLGETNKKGPCVKFWSNLILENIDLADNWKMKQIDEEVIIDESQDPGSAKLVKSRLLAEKGDTKKEITHYHYVNWKDLHTAPSDAVLLQCAKIACKHLQETKAPVGINCNAGIGRTGSLALLTTAMQHINEAQASGKKVEEISINIPELYYGLRNQRKLSILKKHQSQLHRILGTYVQELKQPK